MYFIIHANICVPIFFLGVGGRVGMCHSWAFELRVCSRGPFLGMWCLVVSDRLLRDRRGAKRMVGSSMQMLVAIRTCFCSEHNPASASIRGITLQKHPWLWRIWVEVGEPGIRQREEAVTCLWLVSQTSPPPTRQMQSTTHKLMCKWELITPCWGVLPHLALPWMAWTGQVVEGLFSWAVKSLHTTP